MQIEFEATFENVEREAVRQKLIKAGAKLIKPDFMQKRVVFDLPKGHEINGGWIRVRDEGDKITLSLKIVDGDKIENQKELMLKIDNFDKAVELLERIGCQKKAYQESKRELWLLDDVEVVIDEWPFLEPFVEIEGKSEDKVKMVAGQLGFDYSKALFCAVDLLYMRKYNIDFSVVNDTPKIIFDMKNPFVS